MIRNMDASEKYIEMCRAADEIQKAWEPSDGDYYRYFILDNPQVYIRSARHGVDPVDPEHWIWLPRQDQLQDLLDGDLTDIAEGFYDYMTAGGYNYECPEFNDTRCKEYGSMEQLWLAYVMESKYSKQWDGTAWIDPNAEKKPTESVFSQIRRAHAKVEADNFKPIKIHMSRKMELALSLELAPYHISTLLQLGVDVSILGMRLIIDDTMSDDEFRIVAELL